MSTQFRTREKEREKEKVGEGTGVVGWGTFLSKIVSNVIVHLISNLDVLTKEIFSRDALGCDNALSAPGGPGFWEARMDNNSQASKSTSINLLELTAHFKIRGYLTGVQRLAVRDLHF